MNIRTKRFLFSVFACLLFSSLTIHAQGQSWRPVSGKRQMNISGMALVEANDSAATFIIVHDNKKPEQQHVGLIRFEGDGAPRYIALEWRQDKQIGELPVDLEAITSVPEQANTFMAFNSQGNVYHIRLDARRTGVDVLKVFTVPAIPVGRDFEGFALQKLDDKLLAVWAERGLDAKPATLFWSAFNLANYTFAETNSASIVVPTTTQNVRHISDVKADSSGAVFITSASDPGNDGPFDSAFYFAGTFHVSGAGKIVFARAPAPLRLRHFPYHKVEGFDFVPGRMGGVVFGTDDENLGSAIFVDR